MTAGEIVRLLVSLVLVVGGLLALRWWSRWGRGPRRAGPSGNRVPIRVVGRAGVAKGASVAVVEVGGQRFLVGASEHGVTLLSELPAAPATEGLAAADGPPVELAPDTPEPATDAALHLFAYPRPRMGLVARLRHMTLRTPDRRTHRAVTS